MNAKDLVSEQKDENFRKAVLDPLITGVIYGVGNFIAYLIINHKWFRHLKDIA